MQAIATELLICPPDLQFLTVMRSTEGHSREHVAGTSSSVPSCTGGRCSGPSKRVAGAAGCARRALRPGVPGRGQGRVPGLLPAGLGLGISVVPNPACCGLRILSCRIVSLW